MFRQISGSLNSVPSFVLFCFILFNKPDFECKERATKSEVRSLEGRRGGDESQEAWRAAPETNCLWAVLPLLPDRMMQWLLLIAIPTNSLIHSFIQSFSVNSFIALHCTALHCIASPFHLFRAIYCACHKSAQSIPNAMPMDCWSGLLLPSLQSLFLSLFGPLFHSPELQPSAISCSFPPSSFAFSI